MIKYGHNKIFNPEKLDTHNIDRQSVDQVPYGANVLEIGCATGFVGHYLIRKKGCEVTGVELGYEEAVEAKKVLTKVIVGNIEHTKTQKLITKKYNVIYASALVEHLKDPWSALKTWKKFLKNDGLLIVTTSNVLHWSQRIKFLSGKFEYEKYGIMDNTHLRFFTTKTFPKLITDCGYKINKFTIDPVSGGYPKVSLLLSLFFPNLFAYQMLIVATPNGR